MKKIGFLFFVIFLNYNLFSQTPNALNKLMLSDSHDSLNGFDLNAAQLYISQNNFNLKEQDFVLYKKKREFIKQKYNITAINSGSGFYSNLLSPQSGTNIDFENGNLNGWTISSGLNQNSSMLLTCCSTSGGNVNLVNNGIDSITNYSLSSPLGGNWVAKINDDTSVYQRMTKITNTFSVTSSENFLNIAYLPVLNLCYHNCSENSYFDIRIFDSNNSVFYQKFIQSSEGSNKCFGTNSSNLILNGMFYSSPWEVLQIDFSSYIGSVYRIEITASGCTLGGHSGYGYVDMSLSQSNVTPSIVSVNNNPYPIISQNQTISVCNSNSLTINAPTGALSYTWSGNGINGLNTQSVSILNPLGTYTVSYTKPAYWGGVTNTIIRVENTPTISVAGPTVACSGSVLSYSTLGANSYTWTPINVITPQMSSLFSIPVNFTQTLSIVAPNATTTYTVKGSTTGGCQSEKYFTLTINPTPTISLISGQTSLCSGNSTTIALQGADSYTWTNPNIVTNSLSISPTQNSTLSVIGLDTLSGCLENMTIPISVYNAATGIGISTLNPKACLGDSIIIIPYGASTYSLNNTSINNSIRLLPLTTTTYTLTGMNPCGIYTHTFTVLVVPKPVVTITGPSTICAGYQLNLVAGGASSYTWTPFSNTTTLTINNFTQSQDIYLTGRTNGCSASAMKSITVLPGPTTTITAYPRHNICVGQTATLTAVGAPSYSWTQGGQTTSSIVVTPTVSGNSNYYTVATGTNGCKASAYIILDVSTGATPFSFISSNTFTICNGSFASAQVCCSASSYLIENTNTVVSNQFTLSPTSTTIYTITSNSGCIVDTKTLQVTVVPSLTYTISGPDSVCQGSVANFSATGGFTSYSWSLNGSPYTTSNTYSLICNATSTLDCQAIGSGCISNYYQRKIVQPKPIKPVTIIGNIASCSTSNATLTAVGSDLYLWSNGFSGNPLVLNNPSQTSYSVLAQSINGCTTSNALNLNDLLVQPSVFVTPVTQTVCLNNQIIPINALPQGGIYYINGSVGTNYFIPATAGNYSIAYSYTDVNGCSSASTATTSVMTNPSLNISGPSQLCQYTSGVFNASGANTYAWNTGATTSSISVIPTTTSVYTVTGTDLNNCSNTQTVSVTVDNTCQDVWPGDANSDGTADNLDVLELGLHYAQTGSPRASVSNTWQSYFANNWAGTITNGKNLNHSDCNGDGTIDDNDTLAIFNNYGLTHAFKPEQTITVNPQLNIVPDQAYVTKGNWGTASIYAGDAITSINNINGLAFTVDFDNTLIETNSIYIEYQNSFLDAGQNLHFRKLDFANGKIYTATTHTNNVNVSGNGKIATLHYQINSTLTTDEILSFGISQAAQSNASGVITPLTTGTGTLMAIGASVGLQELNGNLLSISPNPTNGLLTIRSKTELQKIEVLSIDGKILLSEVPTNISHTLHLDNFANGIYFVNLYQNNRIVKREKIVLNK